MDNNLITNEDERLKILKMVESGRISASEGASLLEALSIERQDIRRGPRSTQDSSRWFRVRVTDLVSGRNKALVSIPMGLMDWGLRIGAQFSPEVAKVDLDELGHVLRSGLDGKIIDVIDEEDGEHVEIFVD